MLGQYLKDRWKLKILLWLTPFLLGTSGILLFVVMISSFLASDAQASESAPVGTVLENKNLSAEVISLQPLIRKYATEKGIPDEVPFLSAIMMVESRGIGPDPMQSSESAGMAPNAISSVEWSIQQGVNHYYNALQLSKTLSLGDDRKMISQAYNFGTAYISWLGSTGNTHSVNVADRYSLTVMAPIQRRNGFPTAGTPYNYPNPIAIPYNGGLLYLHSGNFFYGELVFQYIELSEAQAASPGGTNGEIAILEAVLNKGLYNGECYGLTAYYVDQMGGPRLMGSGFMYAWKIGHDYNWGAHGWEVIFNPKYEQLRPGDIINWHPGGAVSPGVYGHTGVIYSVDNNGNFSTYEQNAEKGRVCAKYNRSMSSGSIASIVRKVN